MCQLLSAPSTCTVIIFGKQAAQDSIEYSMEEERRKDDGEHVKRGFAESWMDVSVWITVVMPSGQQERKIIM